VTQLSDLYRRVALAHDWLTIPGGSEKVVLALLELLPGAELFTSVYDPAPWPAEITGRPVHVSGLNRIPGATARYRWLLPLMDRAFRSFDLSGYDLIVSSSHANAKNVRTPPGVPHVCYCHTPMRYLWDPDFLRGEFPAPLRPGARMLLPQLRRADLRGARQPDVILANSRAVAGRIGDWWGREAHVVHPPVEIDRFQSIERRPQEPYLVLGRLVPYKRAELAVAACERLGRPLWVVGAGRHFARVRQAAGPHTEFLGAVGDCELPGLLSRARALLFPGEEDFGMVPVEAQAAGVPVIAYGAGGALDTVIDGVTGVLYREPSVKGLCRAIERFESLKLEEAKIRDNAARFGPQPFREQMTQVLLAVAGGAVTGAPAPPQPF
jgi:glycosyltransferase involved in cell wall biosynthesis